MNQCLYIDVRGFVWEVRKSFDISLFAKNSRCENIERRGWSLNRKKSGFIDPKWTGLFEKLLLKFNNEKTKNKKKIVQCFYMNLIQDYLGHAQLALWLLWPKQLQPHNSHHYFSFQLFIRVLTIYLRALMKYHSI